MFETPAALRLAVRGGDFSGPTAGLCPGFVQTNLVILPHDYADEFAEFCRLNPKPCPLVEALPRGIWRSNTTRDASDLRSDLPRYRIFRHGTADAVEPTDVAALWRDDFCAFLIGCSFTFENALAAAGLPVRHCEERRNVPMYRTTRPCAPAGRFAGPLVVSMRPYRPEQISRVVAVTERFATMHGGPIHVGDPHSLGIHDLSRPDFGEAVTIRADEVPVFWACGVTPQLALAAARPEVAVTHSPGCMFVTDLRDEIFCYDPV